MLSLRNVKFLARSCSLFGGFFKSNKSIINFNKGITQQGILRISSRLGFQVPLFNSFFFIFIFMSIFGFFVFFCFPLILLVFSWNFPRFIFYFLLNKKS